MFQDEARFGRMVRIRRCWAPAPQRPVVDNGYEREFQYVYGAVSPLEGELDWRIGPVMNTEQMGSFLAQVSAAHPEDFIVMAVDGASSHVAKALVVPENIRLMSRRFGSWIRGLCRLPKSLNRLGAYFAGLTSSLPALWADDRP